MNLALRCNRTTTNDARSATKPSQNSIDAVVDLYIDTALPGGHRCLGTPFHHREHWMKDGWLQPRVRLARNHIHSHLSGKRWIATRWPERIDFFEIDIDAKDADGKSTLLERLNAVVEVLDGRRRPKPLAVSGSLAVWGAKANLFDVVPGIIWRSSADEFGGLRYRCLLDHFYDRGELEARVRDAFEPAGLLKKGSRIEVRPSGEKTSRAPLGLGSMIVGLDGQPLIDLDGMMSGANVVGILGHRTRAGRIVRSIAEYVREWAKLAASKRLPLEAFFNPRPIIHVITCTPPSVKNRGERGAPAASPRASQRPGATDWRAKIDEIEVEGAPLGERAAAFRDLTFDLAIVRGLDEPAYTAAIEDWLRNAPHTSKDLSGDDRDRVITRMLDEAGARYRALEAQGLDKTKRNPSPFPLLSSRIERYTHGKGWRDALIATLSKRDRRLVERESDPRLRRALGVLLALIRRTQVDRPDGEGIAVPCGVLKTIMGGGSRKWIGADGEPVAPYSVLLNRAVALGVLGPVLKRPSKRLARATIFGLPSRRP